MEQILKSETLGLGSSAAKNLISFTMRVSKWITMGIYVEFHFLNEDTKTPRNQTSKNNLKVSPPSTAPPPKALVLCNNFNSSSAAASLDIQMWQLLTGKHTRKRMEATPLKTNGWNLKNVQEWKMILYENHLQTLNFHLSLLGV